MGYNKDKYFAAEDAETTAEYLSKKGYTWFEQLHINGYIEKLRRSWHSYHGSYHGSWSEGGHSINFAGESGELVNIAVNHYRNIASNMITMITSNRPAFQAKSTNTDSRSQIQTVLANGLLEYYLRDKRLEKYLKTAAEYAVVLGAGYVKMEWNATAGKIYDYIDPTEDEIFDFDDDDNPLDEKGNLLKPFPVYEGDVRFTNLSPFDVVFDTTKETSMDHDWVLVRSFKNKYDLAEKYPELREEILKIRTKSETQRYRVALSPLDETVDVAVYEFYHKRTESMPQGRYMMYLSSETVLIDTAMPYRHLPIYRISPGDILGTSHGYTPMFDLLPLQDAVNSLYSTVLTNQNAFGVQSVLNPRGNDVRVTQVESGLNFIEYNPIVQGNASGRPEPLNLTQTPAEIFNFMQMLERQMEVISGVNSVVRGDPEKSIKSGTAMALIQSNSLQFMSGLQQSYIMMIEDVGTGLLHLLQDFAQVPRIAEIAGISNKNKMKEFSSKDIDSISRVVVDVGNALSQSTAGRVEMANNLIQMGLITKPEQYFSVMNTGKLETMTEDQTDQNLLVKKENEMLLDGEEVIAVATDSHSLHIRMHKAVLDDPDLRKDPDLVARTTAHIMEHINLLRETQPDLLTLMGEQPLSPVGGTPVAPGTVAPEQVPAGAPTPDPLMANPQAQSLDPMQNANLPAPPAPPIDPNTGMPFGS